MSRPESTEVALGISGLGDIGKEVLRQTAIKPYDSLTTSQENFGPDSSVLIEEISGLPRLKGITHLRSMEDELPYVAYDSRRPDIRRVPVSAENGILKFNGEEILYSKYKYPVDDNDKVIIDSETGNVINEKSLWTWSEIYPDSIVIEATGIAKTSQVAKLHIDHGARGVIISSPAKDETQTIVVGVNLESYDPKEPIVSTASCTTNASAPIVKVLKESGFEIAAIAGFTVHNLTKTNESLDHYSRKQERGRSGWLNIIETNTGAAQALMKIFPELESENLEFDFDFKAVRVPIPDVSLVNLDFFLRQPSSMTEEQLLDTFRSYATDDASSLRGVLGIGFEKSGSKDYLGYRIPCIINPTGIRISKQNRRLVRISAYYDPVAGYTRQMMELSAEMQRRM